MGAAFETAKRVTRSLGMTHKPFCQGDIVGNFDEEHHQGVCFGLSTIYLAFLQGTMDGDFFATLKAGDFTKPGVVGYVSLAQNWQLKKDLSEAGQLSQEKIILEMFGYAYVDSQPFDQTRPDYTAFAEYAGRNAHFSMVHIPGHAMAAAGKAFGMRFFDPNSGEASCNTTGTMARFMSGYLHTDAIRNFYLRNSNTNKRSVGARATLTVNRYKRRGS